MTGRERCRRAIERDNPDRLPFGWYCLPIAVGQYPDEVEALRREFPVDIGGVPAAYRTPPPTVGNEYGIGRFTDVWGCTFENIQSGVIGEVKHPIVADWADTRRVHLPTEWQTLDRDEVNRAYAQTDGWVVAPFCPRPFEQLQFLRGTEALYCDLMDEEPAFLRFLDDMRNLYAEAQTLWAQTDVDCLQFMDDWGSQKQLLIPPDIWRRLFKPIYREQVEIAHSHGKKIHMHSDGYILEILPDLIEIGVDVINMQVFCMGIENVKPFAEKIALDGEIDRQYLLSRAPLDEVEAGVRAYHKAFWHGGGTIAQLEFGPGAKPENVRRALEVWRGLPV